MTTDTPDLLHATTEGVAAPVAPVTGPSAVDVAPSVASSASPATAAPGVTSSASPATAGPELAAAGPAVARPQGEITDALERLRDALITTGRSLDRVAAALPGTGPTRR